MLGIFFSQITNLLKVFDFKTLMVISTLFGLILMIVSTFGEARYRNFFGESNRFEGIFLEISVFLTVLIGISISSKIFETKFFEISLTILSFSLLFLVYFQTVFKVDFPNIINQYDLESPSYRENSNFLAPVLILTSLSFLISDKKFRNLGIKILFLLSLTWFTLTFQLIQIPVVIGLSIGLFLLISRSNLVNFLYSIPLVWIVLYSAAIPLLSNLSNFLDSSMQERLRIINFCVKEVVKTPFIPKVDGLADLASNFPSLEYVDNCHNIFLQKSFSFGVLYGLVYFFLLSLPFFLPSSFYFKNKTKIKLLTLYSAFYFGLFFGIVSNTYYFWGILLLGILLGKFMLEKSMKTKQASKNAKIVLRIFYVTLLLFPTILVIEDFRLRLDVVRVSAEVVDAGFVVDEQVSELLLISEKLKDAENRFLIARNFLVIGKCTEGSKVIDEMTLENKRERRIKELLPLLISCESSNRP